MIYFQLGGPEGSDAVAAETLKLGLLGEIEQIDGLEISAVEGAPAPAGAKSPWVELAGSFAAAITSGTATAAAPMVVDTIRDWLGRQKPGTSIHIKTESINATITGNTPAAALAQLMEHLKTNAAVK